MATKLLEVPITVTVKVSEDDRFADVADRVLDRVSQTLEGEPGVIAASITDLARMFEL